MSEKQPYYPALESVYARISKGWKDRSLRFPSVGTLTAGFSKRWKILVRLPADVYYPHRSTMKAIPRQITTTSPDETRAWAGQLIRAYPTGTVFALHGPLGAGKTCLVQGMADALGLADTATSPTYTLIHEYKTVPPLYHVDLYRVHSSGEALALGLEEYFETAGFTAIEWAERASNLLPATSIHIHLEPGRHPEERLIALQEGPRP